MNRDWESSIISSVVSASLLLPRRTVRFSFGDFPLGLAAGGWFACFDATVEDASAAAGFGRCFGSFGGAPKKKDGHSRDIRGKFGGHSGDICRTFRRNSRDIRVTFRWHFWDIPGRSRDIPGTSTGHSRDTVGTFLGHEDQQKDNVTKNVSLFLFFQSFF